MNKIVRIGSFNGMLEKRTFNIVYVTKEKPTSFDLKTIPAKKVVYVGKKTDIRL